MMVQFLESPMQSDWTSNFSPNKYDDLIFLILLPICLSCIIAHFSRALARNTRYVCLLKPIEAIQFHNSVMHHPFPLGSPHMLTSHWASC